MRTIGTFRIPAIAENKDWKYYGWRVVVTDRSDTFLTRYLLNLVRS